MDVTDDVSIIENMGLPVGRRGRGGAAASGFEVCRAQVKITVGEYTNLKLTTPSDLIIAREIMRSA